MIAAFHNPFPAMRAQSSAPYHRYFWETKTICSVSVSVHRCRANDGFCVDGVASVSGIILFYDAARNIQIVAENVWRIMLLAV